MSDSQLARYQQALEATTWSALLELFKQELVGFPEMTQLVLLAYASSIHKVGVAEGRGRSNGSVAPAGSPTFNIGTSVTKTNSDNMGSAIATGAGSNALSNTGNQQGVGLGSGSTTVSNSMQSAGAEFDTKALEAEIAPVLHQLLDRIEGLEDADKLSALTQVTALRELEKADLDSARTLQDVHRMLEDLWDDKMNKRYGALAALGSLEPLLKSAPTLIKLIKSLAT